MRNLSSRLGGDRKLVTCKHCLRLLKKADAGSSLLNGELGHGNVTLLRVLLRVQSRHQCLETLVLGGEFVKKLNAAISAISGSTNFRVNF